MRHSIRYKYTLIFISTILLILLGIWCTNNLFLEHYYIRNKERILKDTYTQIDSMLKENPDLQIDMFNRTEDETEPENPGAAYLRELGEKYNISILLIDEKTGAYLSTEPRNGRLMEMQIKDLYRKDGTSQKTPPPDFPKDPPEVLFEGADYKIEKVYNAHVKSSYLQSIGRFEDQGVMALMSLPLASIRESVALSNRFLTLISLGALVAGSLAVFITSKRVTAPILELSRISGQMSRLDFNVKYEGKSQDEIGVLGSSMNTLSDRLKDTMGQLQSANEQLRLDIEQKNRIDEMRKNFVSNVSHELKTPITIIHGYAEGLADGMCKDEESRSFYYQVILNESDKMAVLVRQLLTLSDLEFGFDLPSFERFDLTELTAGVLNSMEMIFKEEGAFAELEQTEPVYVRADEFKIEQVLNNYLSNALNHLTGEKRIRIRIERQGGVVKAFVYNSGAQIPEEELAHLWTKFYKVDKARSRQYGGSGIGLSIVKAVMDSHGQTCGVENREDGVEFWFAVEGA